MRRLFTFLLLVMLIFCPLRLKSLEKDRPVSIIPQPMKMKNGGGSFIFNASTKIIVPPENSELQSIGEQLANRLRVVTGYRFPIIRSSDQEDRMNGIMFVSGSEHDRYGKEGYELAVKQHLVTIKASTPNGFFYAVQSFYQLLPPDIEKGEFVPEVKWSAPCVTVEDKPRFPWRGMHLDVGRHFAPKEFVIKYIDLLASYKMNTFHWHLTEDQGWRIEIRKYPRLTSVGSQRRETMGDCTPYGGFYTQEDIREVVEYAKQCFITIVPEIEMPGHSLAALAAYPELSCSGGPFKVGTEWGVINDVYCAGDEKTYQFIQDVIDEVTALFPGPFFHIGGDECPKLRWSNCKKCQDRIKAEGLKDERELQSYFIRRIEKLLNAKGKRLVGWDEILEGGLAPNATVMSWRGVQGGIEAAKSGHDVVMTPTSHCYFDYSQSVPGETTWVGGFLPIDTVYAYEPVPSELSPDEAKHILGSQGNVWTEGMPTTRLVEYQVVPRICAMSEVVWTEKSKRDFKDFAKRLEQHFDRFVARDLNFRVPTPLGLGGTKIIFKDTTAIIINPISTGSVFYTLDGQSPSMESKKYSSPIGIIADQTLKAAVGLSNGRMSNPITTNFFRVDPKINGVEYRYYEGEWDKLPSFSSMKPVKEGRVYDIGLTGIPHRGDNFAVMLDGYLKIDQEGEYTLYLTSDDGSKMFIDDRLLIDNDGLHPAIEMSAKISLNAGKHKITVQQFELRGGEALGVAIEGPNMPKQPLPPRMLVYQ